MFDVFKKISLISKANKAYKSIKKVIDNNSANIEELKAGFELIKQGLEKIITVCPEVKEVYVVIKEAIAEVFTKKK